MKKLILIIALLFIPIGSFAQSPKFGKTYNSKTGKNDMCTRVRSEDGTTIDAKKCKEFRVTDGYIDEINGYFLISVGKCNAVTKTADYTVTVQDCLVLCDATNNKVTLTLPTVAASCSGTDCRLLDIKKIDSSENLCIVDGSGSETIDEGLTAELASQYESIKLQADSTEWWIK